MKILLIGDPHFKVSNCIETNQLHKETIKYIQNTDLDFVVILGDVLDTHEKIHIRPLCRAVNYITSIAKLIKTYVLIGNHDRLNNNVFLTDDHPFSGLKNTENIIIVDKVYQENNFIFVPYVYPGRFQEALETIDFKPNKQFIFAHQEFKGVKMGAFVSEIGDGWPEDYPYVFSGHIHDFQQVQKNILYTGTPFQHGFSDSCDKFLVLIETNDYDYTMEKVYLDIIKKRVLQIDFNQLKSYEEDKQFITKLIIEGNSKLIRKILQEKDIKFYKIRDNTIKKSSSYRYISFEDSFNQRLKTLTYYDKEVYDEIFTQT